MQKNAIVYDTATVRAKCERVFAVTILHTARAIPRVGFGINQKSCGHTAKFDWPLFCGICILNLNNINLEVKAKFLVVNFRVSSRPSVQQTLPALRLNYC